MMPFFATKPVVEGAEQRLSLGYDIVNKGYNGNISVNRTEGEGSEFIITLPVG